MKKSILSLLIGFSVATQAYADDLYQVYQRALEQDPTINKAKADRDAAFEGISISRANLLPQISGVIGYTDSTSDQFNFTTVPVLDPSTNEPVLDQNGDPVTTTEVSIFNNQSKNLGWDINLSLSIYDHQNWVGLNRAEKVAQQSDTTYALAKQELIVRTTIAYLAVLRAQDGLEFVKAEKRAIERQLEQTKQRFEVGLTAITDVHEAQANFDNTVAQEIVAENLVELRLEELREITGKYHDNLSVLNTESFTASRPIPERVDGWLEIAEEKNLDLMVSKLATEIAKDDIKNARAGHYPTVSLTASIGSNDTELNGNSSLPTRDNDSIGIQLNVPIYSGGRVSSQTAQAKYNFISASESLELAHRSTVRSIRSSYNDVVAATSTIRALEQAVVSAQSALQATEAGFDVGTRTIVDVLNSTRNLFDARRNLAGARYDFISAVMTLKRSAGNLTEQDLIDINRGLRSAS
ncbi:outer membrane channel protein TolC [Aliiglaciecola lipolytica]|uniref:Outer membrane channel protein TolC n=1 Tax=Aliiglaciecola lipolytica E3 TaxID=1127673 RepID=K6XZ39_9ALTE|nr:outer membrane channel protein TolC [Aliiglaciecola lipolytica]GAC16911.1 outer membrane channel protein TolC [Aliiglaciecola lipolytica E3]